MIVTDPLGVSEPLTPPGQLHLLTLQTRNRNSLAAFFHELPGATYTLLFSHGNAVRNSGGGPGGERRTLRTEHAEAERKPSI